MPVLSSCCDGKRRPPDVSLCDPCGSVLWSRCWAATDDHSGDVLSLGRKALRRRVQSCARHSLTWCGLNHTRPATFVNGIVRRACCSRSQRRLGRDVGVQIISNSSSAETRRSSMGASSLCGSVLSWISFVEFMLGEFVMFILDRFCPHCQDTGRSDGHV